MMSVHISEGYTCVCINEPSFSRPRLQSSALLVTNKSFYVNRETSLEKRRSLERQRKGAFGYISEKSYLVCLLV